MYPRKRKKKKPKPKPKKPLLGHTVHEVARLTTIPPRGIRHYVALGLLQAPPARGPSTRYTDEHVLRLRVIRLLRTRDRLPAPEIRKRLAGLTTEQLRALLPPDPPPPSPAPLPEPALGGSAWQRIELLPGIELHVRPDAGALVRRLAHEIRARYAVHAAAPPPAAADRPASGA